MKKVLLTAVIASMLIVPLGNTALAGQEEDTSSTVQEEFIPGNAPASAGAAEAMLPAIHGAALAMLNRDAGSFDLDDGELAWEGL